MRSGPYRKWNVQMGLTCELSWFVVTNPQFGGRGDRQQRTEVVWQCGRAGVCSPVACWRRVTAATVGLGGRA